MFCIGPIQITSVIITEFALVILLTVLSIIATRHMKVRPTGLQAFAEKMVDMMHGFISGIVGPKLIDRYFPYLATLYIFILCSSYTGLLPFAGELWGLKAPTTAISVTATLAIMTFFLTHYTGARAHGIKYLGHFCKPVVFLLPLMLVEELVRPLSLTLRLFGNTFGDEAVTAQMFGLVPIGVPIIMQLLGLLMGLVQATVFVLLSGIYFNLASEEE